MQFVVRSECGLSDVAVNCQYVYFFEMQTPEVTRNYLKGLVALVQDHLANMEHGQTRNESEFRFRDVLRYMDAKGLTVSS